MYGDSISYFKAIDRAWDIQDGKIVADLLCLRDSHINNRGLHVHISDSLVERHLPPPIDEIVSNHLSVIFCLVSGSK